MTIPERIRKPLYPGRDLPVFEEFELQVINRFSPNYRDLVCGGGTPAKDEDDLFMAPPEVLFRRRGGSVNLSAESVAFGLDKGRRIRNAQCHRYLIGLEDAEAQTKRERSIGWQTGCIDPGVSPADYVWNISGDDVLCHAVDTITPEYAQTLGLCLIEQGARIVCIFNLDGQCLFGQFPQINNQGEEIEMKTKIKLHETLYQSGCPGCYPGVTSATPVAWICEDIWAVVLRQDGGYRVEDMSSKELASFETCEQAQKDKEKNKELNELIDEIAGVHPGRLAGLLFDRPEELHKIRPLLDSAQKTFEENSLGDDLPLYRFSAESS